MANDEDEVQEKFLQVNSEPMDRKERIPKDISCGIWKFKGSKLQKFATENMFMVIYGISGCFIAMAFAYSNGTITTLEKRFKIPTKISGLISVGNDISSVFCSIFLAYYAGRGHRPRWIAMGLLTMTIFCLMTALPHFLYGAGEEALKLAQQLDTSNSTATKTEELMLCHRNVTTKCEGTKDSNASIPVILLFIAQFISGIGGSLFFTLGLPYMDDNSLKSKTPAMLSWSAFLRMLGPAVGYSLASFCLRLYIDPTIVPSIKNSDPRWLGAWWLGWLILAVTMLISAFFIYMFPRELPSAHARRLKSQMATGIEPTPAKELSLGNMLQCIKRLAKNKVYVCNSTASTLYVFGYLPYWIFTPKYIETQYRQSAATASMATGPMALGFSAAGVLLTGYVLSKYKPSARAMAAWNAFVDLLTIAGILCYVAIGCDESDRVNTLSALTANADNCSLSCHCDYVPYAPICGSQNFTYISACHAGCQYKELDDKGRTIYTECKCINSDTESIGEGTKLPFAVDGPCPVDCYQEFLIFMGVMCFLKFVGSTGRVTNLLLALRCVPPEDKTFALGFGNVIVSVFSLIPSPIIFGWILDHYCLVWGKTCNNKGNCWLYDTRSLRYVMNLISAGCIFLGCFWNFAVWYYAKDLEIFDENEDKPKNQEMEFDLKEKTKKKYNTI